MTVPSHKLARESRAKATVAFDAKIADTDTGEKYRIDLFRG